PLLEGREFFGGFLIGKEKVEILEKGIVSGIEDFSAQLGVNSSADKDGFEDGIRAADKLMVQGGVASKSAEVSGFDRRQAANAFGNCVIEFFCFGVAGSRGPEFGNGFGHGLLIGQGAGDCAEFVRMSLYEQFERKVYNG